MQVVLSFRSITASYWGESALQLHYHNTVVRQFVKEKRGDGKETLVKIVITSSKEVIFLSQVTCTKFIEVNINHLFTLLKIIPGLHRSGFCFTSAVLLLSETGEPY